MSSAVAPLDTHIARENAAYKASVIERVGRIASAATHDCPAVVAPKRVRAAFALQISVRMFQDGVS
jgi:hypothetical protein